MIGLRETPEHAIANLSKAELERLSNPQLGAANPTVSLSVSNGWFKLVWATGATGKYDWVGLYTSADAPDADYIGGLNWQWVDGVLDGSYITWTSANPGYQARYLVWDTASGSYVSVARSAVYPG